MLPVIAYRPRAAFRFSGGATTWTNRELRLRVTPKWLRPDRPDSRSSYQGPGTARSPTSAGRRNGPKIWWSDCPAVGPREVTSHTSRVSVAFGMVTSPPGEEHRSGPPEGVGTDD